MVRLAPVALVALASAGCVSKVHYDECIADVFQTRAAADARQKEDAARIGALEQQIAQGQAALQDAEGRFNDLSTSSHNTQTQLDEATAINQELRGALQRLGTDVDKMLAERGTLSKALDDAKARLDELRKAQAEGEARAQVFRDFQLRFRPLLDSGQLRIDSKRGELVMNVQGDLLFDGDRSELRTAGTGALMEIAKALETVAPPPLTCRFLVTANVDDDERKPKGARARASRRAPSAWELTAARAVAVVEYMVSLGVPATSLTAAAAGSSDPIVANDTPQDRARNRRIEIALLPESCAEASVARAQR